MSSDYNFPREQNNFNFKTKQHTHRHTLPLLFMYAIFTTHTFRSLQSDDFAVFALAGAVERFYSGVVRAIEVQSVDSANSLYAAVHLLQAKSKYRL